VLKAMNGRRLSKIEEGAVAAPIVQLINTKGKTRLVLEKLKSNCPSFRKQNTGYFPGAVEKNRQKDYNRNAMKNTTINAAKKMLEDGLPIETISKYTGLMKNEIEKLRETYQ
jgi:hypothetical protein